MAIFRVNLKTFSPTNGRPEFLNFDSPAHENIAALTSALDNGTVVGVRLHANKIPDSVPKAFKVNHRFPFLLEKVQVHSIEYLPVELYDEQGNALHAAANPTRHKSHEPADLRPHP